MTLSLWSQRGSATTTSPALETVANFTVNKPTGVVAGDLLFVTCYQENNTEVTVTPPTGFTKLTSGSNTTPLPDARIISWYKIADGTEGSSFTFTHSSVYRGAVCVAYKPAVAAPTLNVQSGAVQTGNNTQLALTAITTTKANCLVLGAATNYQEDNFSSVTSPYALNGEAVGANGGGVCVISNEQAVSGSTGGVTITFGGTVNSVGALYAFAPADVVLKNIKQVNQAVKRAANW